MKIGCQIGAWKGYGGVVEAVRAMGAAGVEGIEVFVHHLKPYYGMESQAKEFLAENNIELAGAYFGHNEFISPEGEEEVVSETTALAKFLSKVGSSFIVLNGGVPEKQKPEGFDDDDFKQLGKTMNSIARSALEYGVSTCVHPHRGLMVVSLADVDRLLEYLDTSLVGLCFHASHQLAEGLDPYEMYEKHAGLVTYLHIAEPGGAFIGEGVLDQKRLMKPILDAGYDGWTIVESSKPDFPQEEYMARAKKYIQEELLR